MKTWLRRSYHLSNKKDFIKKDRFKSLEIAASRVSENISEVKDEIM